MYFLLLLLDICNKTYSAQSCSDKNQVLIITNKAVHKNVNDIKNIALR